MLKVERSPSHSWWWDSHNSPKHSKWLQSNLQDLDDKVKEMLKLIEEDADSFAQRAEMYYQKRPELVNLVEEFYRAYRSLAERYDHLTGEIRHNIPRALQVQYGLSCDSPRSAGANGGGRHHHYSPLRRSNQLFENLLKKAGQNEPTKDMNKTADYTHTHTLQDDKCVDDDGKEQDGCIDMGMDSHPNSSDEGGLSSSSSDSEVDNLTPLIKLRAEINELKEMNKGLTESRGKTLELNTALQSKVRDLEAGYKSKDAEVNDLKCKLLELNADHLCMSAISSHHCGKSDVDGGHADNVAESDSQVEILPFIEEVLDSSMGEEETHDPQELFKSSIHSNDKHLGPLENGVPEQRVAYLRSLEDKVGILREENRKQQVIIHERGEEKREVIRQLSVSMEILKSENQRLEVAIGLLKKRLHAAAANGALHSHSPLTACKQLLSLVGFKACRPFVAVAI